VGALGTRITITIAAVNILATNAKWGVAIEPIFCAMALQSMLARAMEQIKAILPLPSLANTLWPFLKALN
jgi:hypothetical protein